MSTITFLPYIGEHFIKEYIISNYVGEALSSLVPGVLGILQGVGLSTTLENCPNNSTNNQTTSLNQTTVSLGSQQVPRFSVSLYFFFMFCLICLSAISFTAINFWDRMRINRKVVDNGAVHANKEVQVEIEPVEPSTSTTKTTEFVATNSLSREKYEMGFLFSLTFVVSFVYYGYLPGIFSYSTIPYGIKYFHLATNISKLLFY